MSKKLIPRRPKKNKSTCIITTICVIMKMILLKNTSHHAHLQAIILDKKRSCLDKERQRNNVNKYY